MVGGVSLVANYRTDSTTPCANRHRGLIKNMHSKNRSLEPKRPRGGNQVIRREGRRILVSGPVTLTNVAAILAEGRRHLEEGVRTVDLSEVNEMDSSLLAAMLAWLRDAKSGGRELTFANLPESLQTIARLYGVDSLIPLAH